MANNDGPRRFNRPLYPVPSALQQYPDGNYNREDIVLLPSERVLLLLLKKMLWVCERTEELWKVLETMDEDGSESSYSDIEEEERGLSTLVEVMEELDDFSDVE